ncbi:hypothetical protein F4803DRAFT_576377 [Xylaria telfairii]|nr:hypothetical protein F4803DRAFT_576377 [Xylaria telfairii]
MGQFGNGFLGLPHQKDQPPPPLPGIGVGWGDYHLFDQWQSHGRLITADMVEEKEWSTQLDKITFVSADDPTDTLTIPISDTVKENATYKSGGPMPKPLQEYLLAKKSKHN